MLRRVLLILLAVGLVGNLLLPGWAQTTPGGISSFNGAVIIASSNTVIFVYPATGGTKPSGVVAALFTDWTAIGILIGVTNNAQYETLDTNTGTPLFINTGTGQPCTSPCPASVFVTVGGPLVHSIVYWLEVVAAISPVYYAQTGTDRQFIRRSDSAVLTSQAFTAPTTVDRFVIYTIPDGAGNSYYVFYGFRFRGSLAATHQLLAYVQAGTLGSQTSSYQVWRWDDTNGDGLVNPSPTDTYTLLSSG